MLADAHFRRIERRRHRSAGFSGTVRPAKVRRSRLLPRRDDRPADLPRPGEQRFHRRPVADPHRALQPAQVLEEPPQHLQHRVTVGEEDVAPHHRIGRCDTGEVAETGSGELDHLGLRRRLEIIHRTDDVVGDQVRHVRGDGKRQVVVRRIHHLHLAAKRSPERDQPVHRDPVHCRIRRQHTPASLEQFRKARLRPGVLGAGNRVAWNQVHAGRNMRLHRLDHMHLHRADV